jgi:hypothetical protein
LFAACKARTDKRALLEDTLRHNDNVKAALKAHRANTPNGVQGIIEFSETLAVDNIAPNDAFLGPTCTLK